MADSLFIARKHISISLKVKQIVSLNAEQYNVYVATYRSGTSGQLYQRIESQSYEDFWSIKAWTLPPHRRLKDPDLIITHGERVAYLVEVKWGSVPGYFGSDLLISVEEAQKMTRLLSEEAFCRVRGPAVNNSRIYRSAQFPVQKDYRIDNQTIGVVVSDFNALEKGLFRDFLKLWKKFDCCFLLADINKDIGDIPSLAGVLRKYSSTLA